MVRNGREYEPSGRGRPGGPRRGGYGRMEAAAIDRQMREEQRFQSERAAPGEDLGWGQPHSHAGFDRAPDRGSFDQARNAWSPGRWQPSETPTVGDLMTENPETVTPDSSLADAARKMRELNVGIIPVVEDPESRRLLGVITDRDITVRAVAEGRDGTSSVREFMTDDVQACHPDDRVRDVLHVMESERVRRVPIVDHAGALVGIIAQADLAVDLGAAEDHLRLRVENTIERISEPARPRRGGWR